MIQLRDGWAQWNTTSALRAKKAGVIEIWPNAEWTLLMQSLRDIPSLRTGTLFDSQTNVILAGAHRASYGLFESLDKDIAKIVYSMSRNLPKIRARNFDIILGLQLATISNQILLSTRYPVTPMAKCQSKSTLTPYYVQSLYHGVSKSSAGKLICLF